MKSEAHRKILLVAVLTLLFIPLLTSTAHGDDSLSEFKLTAGIDYAAESDQFGYSVDISGDWAVVGAPFADSVYVFQYDESTSAWSEDPAVLTAPVPAGPGQFGWSVAIDGDTAVVGAPFAGAAYVYARSNDIWDNGLELMTGAWVGSSVAVSGDTVAVAAPSYTSFPLHPPSGPGSVSLFSRSGETWNAAGTLNSEANGFGASVAISGNMMVVGAPQDNDGGKLAGSAYLFKYDGTAWVADSALPKVKDPPA